MNVRVRMEPAKSGQKRWLLVGSPKLMSTHTRMHVGVQQHTKQKLNSTYDEGYYMDILYASLAFHMMSFYKCPLCLIC